jgi:DNA-binding transcriptional regulator YdaS (Cro superfamily)
MDIKTWLDERRGKALALAKGVGVPPSFISKLSTGAKQPSAQLCVAIEKFTEGRVTRADLRPDDYWLIWPDLPAPATTPVACAE